VVTRLVTRSLGEAWPTSPEPGLSAWEVVDGTLLTSTPQHVAGSDHFRWHPLSVSTLRCRPAKACPAHLPGSWSLGCWMTPTEVGVQSGSPWVS
jgi:hypothetical protein